MDPNPRSKSILKKSKLILNWTKSRLIWVLDRVQIHINLNQYHRIQSDPNLDQNQQTAPFKKNTISGLTGTRIRKSNIPLRSTFRDASNDILHKYQISNFA